ncbi:MAG: AraC family transcriptional regulator [Verrucomicrobiota bacterium]
MATRAIREQVPWGTDEFVFCEHLKGTDYGTPWHFHPELEIILARKSGGHRIVGDNITSLQKGDLVLLGSDLPHVWVHDQNAGSVDAIVVQFLPNFAGQELHDRADFKCVRELFKRAQSGLQIHGATREKVAACLDKFPGYSPIQRVAELLGILHDLTTTKEFSRLCARGYVSQIDERDHDRVHRVMRYIHSRLNKTITRRQVAEVAALSESAFSRFFHTCTGRTLPAYLNEIRLGRAARLLTETTLRVSDIASDCGFSNLSNFNRLFLKWKNMTPLTFRRKVMTHASDLSSER